MDKQKQIFWLTMARIEKLAKNLYLEDKPEELIIKIEYVISQYKKSATSGCTAIK
jgi:hypothetical protein